MGTYLEQEKQARLATELAELEARCDRAQEDRVAALLAREPAPEPAPSASDVYDEIEMRRELIRTINTLTRPEQFVLNNLYGLGVYHERPLAEVALHMRTSHLRVRMLEQQALCKLRKSARREHLQPFMRKSA